MNKPVSVSMCEELKQQIIILGNMPTGELGFAIASIHSCEYEVHLGHGWKYGSHAQSC